MSAAAYIVVAAVLYICRIVGMRRTRYKLYVFVICRACISVFNNCHQRRAGGFAAVASGLYYRDIRLFALCGAGVVAGRAAGHLLIYIFHVDVAAGR